jgi:hypothetical protein
VIDATFVALLAFGLVIQLGISVAIIMGLVAFNLGSLLGRVMNDLVALVETREMLPMARPRIGFPILPPHEASMGALGKYAQSRVPLRSGATNAPPT